MKYFFSIVALIGILLSGNATVLAQSTDSCSPVNSSNVSTCCTNATTTDQKNACEAYYNGGYVPTGVQTTTTSCNNVTATNFNDCCVTNTAQTTAGADACREYYSNPTPVAGQVGSGTQSTNPINSTTYNPNPSLTPSVADQKAVATCSAIKFNTLLDMAIWVKCIIGVIIVPGIFTLAFVVFLWGVFKFIRSSEQKDKQESKQFIYMGLIGLFVMVSVWGILKILGTTLGIDATVVPTLQTTTLDIKNASKK